MNQTLPLVRKGGLRSDVNEALYQWFCADCSKNIYILVDRTKAKEIATRLGVSNFEGTNGWLEKWKIRYNMKKLAISGHIVKFCVHFFMEEQYWQRLLAVYLYTVNF